MEEPSKTPTDIERIVDRKLVRQRVHYYVVWKGFGEENNTWETRIDLMADGYAAVIKRFEDQRKKDKKAAEGGKSTPRGRSPGRGRPKGLRSKSPRRSRTRSRSRSASVARQASKPEASSTDKTETESASSSSSTSTTRRSKNSIKSSTKKDEASANDENKDANAVKTPKRRSARKPATPTQFVSRLETEDETILLRDTLASLSVPQVREVSAASSSSVEETAEGKKKLSLAYEEEESVLLGTASATNSASTTTHVSETSSSASVVTPTVAHAGAQATEGGVGDMLAKMTEGGWLASFLSVAAVVGSLVASQLLPRDDAKSVELWRRWLPFLTPVVALLLFFHQKDARASAKWVATGLAWRGAAELLVLMGTTPREFETLALGSVAAANTSLLLSLVSTLRHGEHQQSKSTLALLLMGVLALFLSDSWVVATEDPELDSRVILMSMALLTIALSPVPTASEEDDD